MTDRAYTYIATGLAIATIFYFAMLMRARSEIVTVLAWEVIASLR